MFDPNDTNRAEKCDYSRALAAMPLAIAFAAVNAAQQDVVIFTFLVAASG
jgi:hypothetical protein